MGIVAHHHHHKVQEQEGSPHHTPLTSPPILVALGAKPGTPTNRPHQVWPIHTLGIPPSTHPRGMGMLGCENRATSPQGADQGPDPHSGKHTRAGLSGGWWWGRGSQMLPLIQHVTAVAAVTKMGNEFRPQQAHEVRHTRAHHRKQTEADGQRGAQLGAAT